MARSGGGTGASRQRRVANLLPDSMIDETTGLLLPAAVDSLEPNSTSIDFFDEVYNGLVELGEPVAQTVRKLRSKILNRTGIDAAHIMSFPTAREDRQLELLSLIVGYIDKMRTTKPPIDPSTLSAMLRSELDIPYRLERMRNRMGRRQPMEDYERTLAEQQAPRRPSGGAYRKRVLL